jgi:pimeloyl-ACP methyl ester carboxylesterase
MIIHNRPALMHARRETAHTHHTAPTQFVEANGIRFAYRRFGKSGGVPLVMHFTGTMDRWDPLVTDGLAAKREVILFNNAGISNTSGEVPTSVEEMAVNAAAFIRALGLAKVDVLGFSLGGFAVQCADRQPAKGRELSRGHGGTQGRFFRHAAEAVFTPPRTA